jgi:acetate kinase
MADCIAVINAGSSSVKFAIYEAKPEEPCLFRGQIEGIGIEPHLRIVDAKGDNVEDRKLENGPDHDGATREILTVGRELLAGAKIIGVGHRVVHGGVRYDAPAIVGEGVIDDLGKLTPLAPLHQPHNLAPIRTIVAVAPRIPQVACFDTAFHRSQTAVAQAFALPRTYFKDGVRRYGFHGLSYEFLVARMREIAPEVAGRRLVIAHLGNGSSMCGVNAGLSVASTMGFTALDGLVMGTRCGALDPGVILYMLQEQHLDAAAIEAVLYKKSGLLGASGISSDMRVLRASSEPDAREAIALFAYRIVRELGSLVAGLGGIDALIFSGGIGEHDAKTRAEVIEGSAWTGMVLDAERNAKKELRISADDSPVSIWAIPTDEERMIARHTAALLS